MSANTHPVFEVIGGKKLSGSITPQGAKNEALEVICATLLTSEPVTISNIPDISDVNSLISLLQELNVQVTKVNTHTYIFEAKDVNLDYLYAKDFQKNSSKLRGSVMIAGPLLGRYGKAVISKPGGDKIGRRKLDTHIIGFKELGAHVNYDTDTGIMEITAPTLQGKYMLLDEPSLTGTANIIMAAVLAKGTTHIYNAACEPYIQQLCGMLNSMGASISGVGSNSLIINGVKQLGGTSHTLLPDMIEVGSFIGLAAMTQSALIIKNAGLAHLGVIPEKFMQLGIHMEFKGDDIFIPEQNHYEVSTFMDGSVLTIADNPWPGFTPDLISIILVTAIQAKGSVLVHQKMFESRLFFTDKLIDMGAQIILCDPHRAVVIGMNRTKQLKGITMSSPDIRAGVALLIAALSAKGKSVIQNIDQIDRGYENIDGRLRALGADIKRVDY